jgi:hypothetical protein
LGEKGGRKDKWRRANVSSAKLVYFAYLFMVFVGTKVKKSRSERGQYEK